MKGSTTIRTNAIRSALEECCTACGESYTAEETNADLCTKIHNYKTQ